MKRPNRVKRFHVEKTEVGYIIVSNYTHAKKRITARTKRQAERICDTEERYYKQRKRIPKTGIDNPGVAGTARGGEALIKYADIFHSVEICKPRMSF